MFLVNEFILDDIFVNLLQWAQCLCFSFIEFSLCPCEVKNHHHHFQMKKTLRLYVSCSVSQIENVKVLVVKFWPFPF